MLSYKRGDEDIQIRPQKLNTESCNAFPSAFLYTVWTSILDF
jgi:hypothetical protein